MPTSLTDAEAAARRTKILVAARWCFLNFGLAKTSLDDIAKRAKLSRSLLYRTFQHKEAIFQAVFADWLMSRQPAVRQIAARPTAQAQRLLDICTVLALEPWTEMEGAPMGAEFLKACEQIDPENEAAYRATMQECTAHILGDDMSAEVFLLALNGLFADQPAAAMLEQRVRTLVDRFTSHFSTEEPPA